MALFTAANITHAHGDKRVLNNVSLQLDRGQKVALVGRNGCGKTTLMNVIANLLKPDDGKMQVARGVRIGILQQNPKLNQHFTLRREAEEAFAGLAKLHDKLDELSHDMAEKTDADELDRLMKHYERIEQRMHAAGGYAVDHKIDATLHGLGLSDETFDVQVADLSGGQKARLGLAKLLLSEPDVLLLDEPTNHLDIEGRLWLEQFLKEFSGAVLLVSHDRWLLDEVVGQIVEMDRGRLYEYPGNYSAYRELREVRRLEQQRSYDKQQTYIRHQKQYIMRYKTGQRAKEARGRQKKLERYIESEMIDQVHDDAVMNLKLPPAERSGDQVISTTNLCKAYGDLVLFHEFNLSIRRGQRIGVIGANGCGKSTLIQALMGKTKPDSGTAKRGTNLSIGYYRQTQEYLQDNDTPVSYLQRTVCNTSDQSARDVAGAFLFSGLEQDKLLGVMSGGERVRCVLAGLVMGGHNLLVLDEPSNHLDIPSAERLEQSLCQFDGTLILITHDRMLLQDTVNELFVFEGNGNVRHFFGTYRDYLREQRQLKRQALAQLNEKSEAISQVSVPNAKPKSKIPKKSKGKGSSLALISMEKLEQQIMDAEIALTELDQQLADPTLYKDLIKSKQVQQNREAAQAALLPLEQEWERRAEE